MLVPVSYLIMRNDGFISFIPPSDTLTFHGYVAHRISFFYFPRVSDNIGENSLARKIFLAQAFRFSIKFK